MKSVIRECALLLIVAVWPEPALARSYLNCLTKRVVIVDAPRGSISSSIEESLCFWIDEVAKTIMLVDGTPLTVRRFDDRWISVAHGDLAYEFDRQNGGLTYAGSTGCCNDHNWIRPLPNCSRPGGLSRLHALQLAFPHKEALNADIVRKVELSSSMSHPHLPPSYWPQSSTDRSWQTNERGTVA
jgi:hypothetical protein